MEGFGLGHAEHVHSLLCGLASRMVIPMLFLSALVIAAVVWMLLASSRTPATQTTQGPSPDPFLEIARERFALGEIDAEQYRLLVDALTRRST